MVEKRIGGAVADSIPGKPPAKDVTTTKIMESIWRFNDTKTHARERLGEERSE
jgi:hypothetical protein